MAADPYDSIPYLTIPQPQTHPDHLATIGRLRGLPTPAPERCRVLEVGCGDGGNLMPLAAALPEAAFQGVDLAAKPIAQARAAIQSMGLPNIEFRQADLMEANESWGVFDYILVQGIYAWVPGPVRDGLLRLCGQLLSPHGVAFISYNTLPGGYGRQIVNDLLHFATQTTPEPEAKIKTARQLLQALAEEKSLDDEYHTFVRSLAAQMLQRPGSALLHDDLAEHYQPVSFLDFVQHAGAHGLRYLGEANVIEMQQDVLPPALRTLVDQLGGTDELRREQAADYLRLRKFRQTLLCRQETAALSTMQADAVTSLLVASPAGHGLTPEAARSSEPFSLETARGVSLMLTHPFAKSVLWHLAQAWPASVPFTQLLREVSTFLRVSVKPMELSLFLLRFYGIAVVELHVMADRFVTSAGPRPRASAFARWQAAQGQTVLTNLRHETVQMNDTDAQSLLLQLDGSHDVEAIADPPLLHKLGHFALLQA